MELLHQRLDPCALVGDLELDAEDISKYDPYEDESQNAKTFLILDDKPEVTPDWGDQYVNAEILLPRGDRMVRGQV